MYRDKFLAALKKEKPRNEKQDDDINEVKGRLVKVKEEQIAAQKAMEKIQRKQKIENICHKAVDLLSTSKKDGNSLTKRKLLPDELVKLKETMQTILLEKLKAFKLNNIVAKENLLINNIATKLATKYWSENNFFLQDQAECDPDKVDQQYWGKGSLAAKFIKPLPVGYTDYEIIVRNLALRLEEAIAGVFSESKSVAERPFWKSVNSTPQDHSIVNNQELIVPENKKDIVQ